MRVYLYDGSFDGLLTTIFVAYSDREELAIRRASNFQPDLLSEPVLVDTDRVKAGRVAVSIQENLSWHTWQTVYCLYLSELPDCDYLIYRYLKLCFKETDRINLAKNNTLIHTIDLYRRKVTFEAQRFKGFVRFTELAPLVFYSKIEPDHNILPLLRQHFTERFSDQQFLIHDLKREYALVYDCKQTYFVPLSLAEGLLLTTHSPDDPYSDLFQLFFQAVTIPERANPRQQLQYMPKRYRKHLPETETPS